MQRWRWLSYFISIFTIKSFNPISCSSYCRSTMTLSSFWTTSCSLQIHTTHTLSHPLTRIHSLHSHDISSKAKAFSSPWTTSQLPQLMSPLFFQVQEVLCKLKTHDQSDWLSYQLNMNTHTWWSKSHQFSNHLSTLFLFSFLPLVFHSLHIIHQLDRSQFHLFHCLLIDFKTYSLHLTHFLHLSFQLSSKKILSCSSSLWFQIRRSHCA